MTNPEMTKLQVALRIAAEEAYERDLVDTCMEKYTVGAGKEYESKQDWLDCKIEERFEIAEVTP